MSEFKQLKQIRIIFFAILIGLLLFSISAMFFVKMSGGVMILSAEQVQYIETIIIILAFVGIPAAHLFHKRKTEHIKPDWEVVQKLSVYRVSFFIKMATFEGLSLLSLLTYLMTANNSFLIIFGIFIVTILINYPTKRRIASELNLEMDEF